MATTRRQAPYTRAEKVAIVTQVLQLYRAGGMTMKSALAKVGISDASFYTWQKAGIRPMPPQAAHPKSLEQRAALVAEVERHRATGLCVQDACRAAGISDKCYYKWKIKSAAPSPLRPVEVTALVPVSSLRATEKGLSLVAPGGYRIDGLGVESAAALLRALSC
jgi:transposase